MKVLVVGGGGREHAIIKKLKTSREIAEIYALPGNGGIGEDAVCVPIAATDIEGMVRFARDAQIDYAVVAPDDPLVMGAADELQAIGIPCFGPSRAAAHIEGSKVFSKAFMERYGIPTARYAAFDAVEAALEYIARCPLPVVVKADGLALGKGVVICQTREEAEAAVRAMMVAGAFGKSGKSVVIEEYLTGPEVTVLAFTDGTALVPMVSSMDHKRALDGDEGANTGGMGAIAPSPFYTPDVGKRCMREIFLPTMEGLNREGRTFRGCLYFGLMLTPDGPKVIEYNCRFGDPEAQAVLALFEGDLFSVMRAVSAGRLSEADVAFARGAAACVVVASGGYPGPYQTGLPIRIGPVEGAIFHHAGTRKEDGALVTAGGRVIGATAVADNLAGALDAAYRAVGQVHFDGAHYRRDIGAKALMKGK